MYTFITVLIVLASLALVFVVIIQKSKGGGLAASFSSSNSIMGVRKTTDVLEKATWYLMGTLMVLCIASTALVSQGEKSDSDMVQQGIEEQAARQIVPQGITGFGANENTLPASPSAEAPSATDAPVQAE
ncbi:MAG: preprotein translocase subunit SecG [Porphyromonadaceae bacterium]|nr:preprotein translocase subunit SecG [Porphyromonadaceae bacterium]